MIFRSLVPQTIDDCLGKSRGNAIDGAAGLEAQLTELRRAP